MNILAEDDIHMHMPVEVTLVCDSNAKAIELRDDPIEIYPHPLPVKAVYKYNYKRKDIFKRRGRKKNMYSQRTFFLFRQSNPDHFPTKQERIQLAIQGLGMI